MHKLTCLHLLPFLATKGSRVLEKKVNETEVSKTVLSHLNPVAPESRAPAPIFKMARHYYLLRSVNVSFSFNIGNQNKSTSKAYSHQGYKL